MPLRRANSRVEVAGIARFAARMSFSMSVTFFLLTLAALFLIGVGEAERVIAVIVLVINGAIAIGSLVLRHAMANNTKTERKIRNGQDA